jgi:hypothetical protein
LVTAGFGLAAAEHNEGRGDEPDPIDGSARQPQPPAAMCDQPIADRDRRQDRDRHGQIRSTDHHVGRKGYEQPPPGSGCHRRGGGSVRMPLCKGKSESSILSTELWKAVGSLRAGKRTFLSSLLEAAARNATAVAGVSLPREASSTPHAAPALWFSVSSQRAGAPEPNDPQARRARQRRQSAVRHL